MKGKRGDQKKGKNNPIKLTPLRGGVVKPLTHEGRREI